MGTSQKSVKEFAMIGFVLLAVLFGMQIMTFIFGNLGATDYLEDATASVVNETGAYINATGYVNVDTTDSLGLYMAIRYGANSDAFAKNKTIVTGTNASTAIPDYNLCLDAVNGSTGAVLFDNIQISFACATKAPSQAELDVLFDGYEAYQN